jgi:hypothetical protein
VNLSLQLPQRHTRDSSWDDVAAEAEDVPAALVAGVAAALDCDTVVAVVAVEGAGVVPLEVELSPDGRGLLSATEDMASSCSRKNVQPDFRYTILQVEPGARGFSQRCERWSNFGFGREKKNGQLTDVPNRLTRQWNQVIGKREQTGRELGVGPPYYDPMRRARLTPESWRSWHASKRFQWPDLIGCHGGESQAQRAIPAVPPSLAARPRICQDHTSFLGFLAIS